MSLDQSEPTVNAYSPEWRLLAADFAVLEALPVAVGEAGLEEIAEHVGQAADGVRARVDSLSARGFVQELASRLELTADGSSAMAAYVEASGMTTEDMRLWEAFTAAQHKIGLALRRQLQARDDISAPDFEVLRMLLQCSDAVVRVGDIGAALGWEQSRTSHQVARMIQRGLLEQVEGAGGADGRSRWVKATPAGVDAALRVMPKRSELLNDVFFSAMDASEREALMAVMSRVSRRIDERHA